MKAASKFRLVDVWVGVRDPRQATKVEHDLIELLVVSVPIMPLTTSPSCANSS
ncbi:MAG: hypothetical protein JNL84_03840 [Candidatus Accumulibacter sp.]|nr:hypothetical protein [Accumulibacter sp.]